MELVVLHPFPHYAQSRKCLARFDGSHGGDVGRVRVPPIRWLYPTSFPLSETPGACGIGWDFASSSWLGRMWLVGKSTRQSLPSYRLPW